MGRGEIVDCGLNERAGMRGKQATGEGTDVK
jgi:hypothetical protein